MTKTLWALVGNGPESLMRITGLIRRKGCTMKKIVMEEVQDESKAYLTITLGVEDKDIDNILHQMRRFQDVYEVNEICP